MSGMFQLEHYLTPDGTDIIGEWLDGLTDHQATARLAARFVRLALGNFGDCKALSHGVWELRIDWGPGYRVYYAQAGAELLILLGGGDKRKQKSDITRAVNYWQDWQRRSKQ